MFRICNLGSGSSGNATIVSDGDICFLIDIGLNKKMLTAKLAEVGYTLNDVSFILVTHLHTDHYQVTAANAFDKSQFYGCFDCNDLPKENYLLPFRSIELKGYKITPLLASHDDFNSHNTLGYRIENRHGEVLVYMTDTGYIPDENVSYMHNANVYMLESNHDRTKLYNNPNYPQRTIERIDGDSGHLSNTDSAINAFYMVGPKTQRIVLMHLSRDNNTPAIALAEYKKVFQRTLMHKNIKIEVSKPFEVTEYNG